MNTQEDETAVSLFPTEDSILFTSWDAESAREGIYVSPLSKEFRPGPVCNYVGVGIDAVTGDTIKSASISIKRDGCKIKLPVDSATGRPTIPLTEESSVDIYTWAPGYVRHKQTVTVKKLDSTFSVNITVQMFSKDRPLASVYFERDSDVVGDSARSALLTMIQQYDLKQIRFEVSGYTDQLGGETYNQTLSQKRAQHVAEVLLSGGLPAERIVSTGRGIERVDGVTTADENPESRRVDIFAADPAED